LHCNILKLATFQASTVVQLVYNKHQPALCNMAEE